MKKVFAILAIAGVMVACNNSSDKKTDAAADSARIADSTRMADSTAAAAKKAMDTTASKMADTSKPKM